MPKECGIDIGLVEEKILNIRDQDFRELERIKKTISGSMISIFFPRRFSISRKVNVHHLANKSVSRLVG